MNTPVYLYYHLIGALAVIVLVLVGLRSALTMAKWSDPERAAALRLSTALLIGWFAIAFGFSYAGAFSVSWKRIPTIELGIVPPIVLGGYLILRSRYVSRLIGIIPPHWLVGIQLYRALGVIFLILYGTGNLPGLFALPAGIGDVAVGLLAPIVAYRYWRNPGKHAESVRRWNIFGIVDLTVAVSMGFLTSPSPLQVFAFDAPNRLIGAFPLVLIPVFLVPLSILLHLASLKSLRDANTPMGTTNASGPYGRGEESSSLQRGPAT